MKGQISTVVRRLSVSKRVAVAAAVLFGLLGIVPYLAVTQEQSEIGEAPQRSPLIGVTSSTQNPLQIALLHWYNADLTTTFRVGTGPLAAAFDGANMWVANAGSYNVTKLRASDGTVLGTFAVVPYSYPDGVAFDGANIWVTNHNSDNVTQATGERRPIARDLRRRCQPRWCGL